jgi:predicted methyltransferase
MDQQALGFPSAALRAWGARLKRFAYEGFRRDTWQHPERVVQALAVRPGEMVADLGSDGGYFTFRFATAVGPSGRVYAVDVDRGLTEYMAKRARAAGFDNIAVILARKDDPLLPPSGVDLIFTCNTYHHLEHRIAYFTYVRRYLRPEGRLAIVEDQGQGWCRRVFGHWTPRAVIQSEMEAAGYHLRQDFGFLPRQLFLVFAMEEAAPSRP